MEIAKLIQLAFGIICILSFIGFLIKTFYFEGTSSGFFNIFMIIITIIALIFVLGFISSTISIIIEKDFNIIVTLISFLIVSITSTVFIAYHKKHYNWNSRKLKKRIIFGIILNILLSFNINYILNKNFDMMIFTIVTLLMGIFFIYIYQRKESYD